MLVAVPFICKYRPRVFCADGRGAWLLCVDGDVVVRGWSKAYTCTMNECPLLLTTRPMNRLPVFSKKSYPRLRHEAISVDGNWSLLLCSLHIPLGLWRVANKRVQVLTGDVDAQAINNVCWP